MVLSMCILTRMDFYIMAVSCVFLSLHSELKFCMLFILGVLRAILVWPRLCIDYERDSFGRSCGVWLLISSLSGSIVRWVNNIWQMLVCILLYYTSRGLIFWWILWWVLLEPWWPWFRPCWQILEMTHFLPSCRSANAPYVAKLYMRVIVRRHGVPRSIVTDRDVNSTSSF